MKKTPSKIAGSFMSALDRKMHTKRGRDVMLYLMCFIAASVFWIIIRLDDKIERDFDLPVVLVNVPDSVIVIDDVPKNISVHLKGKGTQFVQYTVADLPKFTIDFRQFGKEGRIALSRTKIESRLRDIFGQSVSVITVNPDSLRVNYTSSYGFKLPLRVNHKVSANSGSVISGEVKSLVDSVTVYTISGKSPEVDYIETESVDLVNLSDTVYRQIAIKKIPGTRILPDKVEVMIPVEQLVSRKRLVQISTENVPVGERLIMYPASIEVSYLAPMRLSNSELPIKATVDYNSITSGSRNVKVDVKALSRDYKVVSVSQDSVEYVIEH